MQPFMDWIENWWTHLQPGDKGTWVGGLATFLTLAVTLIISAVSLIVSAITAIRQRSRELRLREEEQNAAKRSHAEKLSCWVAGRINGPAQGLQVHPGDLVVTLVNASEQPFTEAVVEVGLMGDGGSVSLRWFNISVVPPGTSWFELDSDVKQQPETLLLSIWFLDNAMRSWSRSSIGTLEETTKEQRLLRGQGAVHVWLHHGDPGDVLGLDDPWLNCQTRPSIRPGVGSERRETHRLTAVPS
jgi:hypothetical protein